MTLQREQAAMLHNRDLHLQFSSCHFNESEHLEVHQHSAGLCIPEVFLRMGEGDFDHFDYFVVISAVLADLF
jgi:hypothetical protein